MMDTIEILGITHDVSSIVEDLAPYGNPENGLRKSRPKNKDGLAQYVWRMVRFHSGADTHMPMTCEFWLKDYFRNLEVDMNYTSDMSQATREIAPLVTYVCNEFGLDDTRASSRWSRAGLM